MARLQRDYSGERRTEFAGCQLTPSERADLEAWATAAGLSISEYLRRLIYGRHLPPPTVSRSDLRAVAVEITRVGTNLNQLAYQANVAGQIRSEEMLHAVLDQVVAAMARVVEL